MTVTNQIILYLYAYIPGLLLATLFWWIDRNQKPSWIKGFFAFFWGTAASIIVYGFWQILLSSEILITSRILDQILNFVLFGPLIEEIIKGLGIFALWKGRRIKNLTDGVVFGLFIGFGFASTENVFYALKTYSQSGLLAMWYQLWLRSVHTVLLHGSTTALLGALVGYSLEKNFFKKRLIFPIGIIVSSTFHSLWNLLGLYTSPETATSSLIKSLMNIEVIGIFGLLTILFLKSLHQTNQKFISQILSRSVLGLIVSLFILYGSYHFFIISQAKSSQEYQVAHSFLQKSKVLKQKNFDLEALHFQDHQVRIKNGVGLSELEFKTLWKNQVSTLKVGLTRVADFWIVYDASGYLNENLLFHLPSSYEKILDYFIDWDLKDYESANQTYGLAIQQISDPRLIQYLKAKHFHLLENYKESLEHFLDLENKITISKPTLLYDRALILNDLEKFDEAIKKLNEMELLVKQIAEKKENSPRSLNLFTNLPKDPLVANFNTPNILAKSRNLQSLLYYSKYEFDKGVIWSEKAYQQAKKINSSVIESNALYLKALNLHASGKYKKSEKIFDEVIADIDNPNLTQKSWSYFFKSDIAQRENRHQEALDYLELAVTLDPKNSLIRKQAISYLIERNYLGDLEIALSFSLRGIDYGIEKNLFRDLSSQLYQRLGIPDKTQGDQ